LNRLLSVSLDRLGVDGRDGKIGAQPPEHSAMPSANARPQLFLIS
jgi:hypothetical protein